MNVQTHEGQHNSISTLLTTTANAQHARHVLRSWVQQLGRLISPLAGFFPIFLFPSLSTHPFSIHVICLDENLSWGEAMCVYTVLEAETPHYRQEWQCHRQAGLRRQDDLPGSEHPGPLTSVSPYTACRTSGERQSRSNLEKGITSSSKRALVTDDLLTTRHH